MSTTTRIANTTLWIIQTLLAALFLFAGYAKLAMPADVLAQQSQLPAAFMQFIAIAEILGGAGLVLPGLLRVHRYLTPLAAGGLVIIMTGATVLTAVQYGPSNAIIPLVVAILSACVMRGRAASLPRSIALPQRPVALRRSA